ncbi:hypothetical protein EOM09_02750 [bacterium]|nr:hypothetical protein [bacterium]
MKIRIYNTKKSIDCEPTQEAIEAAGVDTYNQHLIIRDEKGYLMPCSSRSGNSFSEDDNLIDTIPIKISLFNFLFNKKNIKKYITDIRYNIALCEYKLKMIEKRKNWIMPNYDYNH